MTEKTIELDCAPGMPRPDSYIDRVVEGTKLEGLVKPPVSKFFGNWVWDFSEVSDEDWSEAQAVTSERIKRLFSYGRIRYGSW